jgi:HEAT repeat protein
MPLLSFASVAFLCLPLTTAQGSDALLEALQARDVDAVDAALASPAIVADRKSAVALAEQELANESPEIRHLAAYALSQLDSTRAMLALPVLVQALEHRDPRIRARIALVLGQMRPRAKAAIPALLTQLQDKDPRARAGAARALGNMGPEGSSAVQPLAGLLKDGETPVRITAALALGQLGRTARDAAPEVKALLLRDSDPEVRAAATYALEAIEPPVLFLTGALSAPDPERRLWAVRGLIDQGAAARLAMPALVRVVQQDDDPAVRAGAALALGKIGPVARSAGPALIESLKDSSSRVRAAAALAVGLIGPACGDAGQPLAEALEDEDPAVVEAAATALGNLGPAARQAVPVLARQLASDQLVLRRRAVNVLARIGPAVQDAIPELLALLTERDGTIRRDACRALVSAGPQATAPLPALIEALRSREIEVDTQVRAWAALSLAEVGPTASSALTPLLETLHDPDASVRSAAVLALGKLGPTAVPALVRGLDDLDPAIRMGCAQALGVMGFGARRSLDVLAKATRDEDPRVGLAAGTSLGRIALALQVQQDTEALQSLEAILQGMQQTKPTLATTADEKQWHAAVTQLSEAVAALSTVRQAHWLDRLLQNPWIVTAAGIGLYCCVLLVVWSLLLWLRPLTLLQISERLEGLPRIRIPVFLGSIEAPVSDLLLLRFFQHRPRVLDAWVARSRPAWQRHFNQQQIVQERSVHVPLPLTLDGQPLSAPGPRELGQVFAHGPGCLLIRGEGGTGKTSLACRLAQAAMADSPKERLCDHAMLPALIDRDLLPADAGLVRSLTETLSSQVRNWADEERAISPDLLEALLRRRRLLVIVDRFSELSAPQGEMFRPTRTDFPIHALIVASRHDVPFDGMPRSVVEPQGIAGDELSSFLASYLSQRGKRQLFDDATFFESCRQLAALAKPRRLTPLLARLYAELLIARQQGHGSANLPQNLPDLMVAHVIEANRAVPPERRRGDLEVLRDAEILAWECVRHAHRPESVSLEIALAVLGDENPQERLGYVEHELGLVRGSTGANRRVAFALGSLAEYLAALHLVCKHRSDLQAWRRFLDEARGAHDKPHAFWTIVRECCLGRTQPIEVVQLLDTEMSRAA